MWLFIFCYYLIFYLGGKNHDYDEDSDDSGGEEKHTKYVFTEDDDSVKLDEVEAQAQVCAISVYKAISIICYAIFKKRA